MEGWIKVHRSKLKWEWFTDYKTAHFFEYLLLKASHNEYKWKGKTYKAGQLPFGLQRASVECGLSVKMIRTALTKLESTGEVAKESSRKGTVITIKKWSEYQLEANEAADESANKGQTKGKQRATTNNVKNENNEKNDNNIYIIESEILKSWNAQKVIVHKETKSKLAEIKRALKTKKDFSPSDIKQAIKNYGLTVNSQDTWFSYKWDLVTFLKNQNALKFYGDNFVLSNYLRSKPSNVHSLQDPAISIGCGANRKFRPENTTQNPYLEELWDEMEQGL